MVRTNTAGGEFVTLLIDRDAAIKEYDKELRFRTQVRLIRCETIEIERDTYIK